MKGRVAEAFDELDLRVGRLMRSAGGLERVLYVLRYQLEVSDQASGNPARAAKKLQAFKEGEVDPLNRLVKHISLYLDKPSARQALGADWRSASELWTRLREDLFDVAHERNFIAHADVFAENEGLVWRGGDVFTGEKRPVTLADLDSLLSRVNACYEAIGQLIDICKPHLVSNDKHEVGRDHDSISISVVELAPEQKIVADWFVPAVRAGAPGTEMVKPGQRQAGLTFNDMLRVAAAYRDEVETRDKCVPDLSGAQRAEDG